MITYCNKQGSRDRKAFAVVISPTGDVAEFSGVSIPKVLAVTAEKFVKEGKWSNTTYTLTLADGVRLIQGRAGFESGLLSDGVASATSKPCNTWEELALAMGAPLPSVEKWLRQAAPRSALTLDERAAALAAL